MDRINENRYMYILYAGAQQCVEKTMKSINLTSIENRISKLFNKTMIINHEVEKLITITSLINNVPNKEYFIERDITEDKLLELLIESYHIYLISLLDKIAKLINEICMLKISSSKCNFFKLVKTGNDMLSSEIYDEFKNLEQITINYRKTRNIIAHSDGFYDEDFFMMSSLAFLGQRGFMKINENQLREEVTNNYKKYSDLFGNLNEDIILIIERIYVLIEPLIKKDINELIDNSNITDKNHIVEILRSFGINDYCV